MIGEIMAGMTGNVIGNMIGEMSNHLWQSTWFAIGAALLTLAFRKNRAQVRYWLWLSASLKFLVPFSLLIGLGNALWYALPARKIARDIVAPAVSFTMVQFTQPFPDTLSFKSPASHAIGWFFIAILGVWACGFSCVALIRFRGWLRIRAAVRASTPLDVPAPFAVRSSPGLLEPGVVGFLRPVLLLPEGILESLTPPQLETVLTHELCHIRRRDNLTAAIHMVVEAVFWFHPAVWWIGSRLVEEREWACDEAVLSLGSEPRAYVEAILNVCKLYVESPLACVSGISGSDLKNRIVRIMTRGLGDNLSLCRKLLLAAVAIAAITGPVIFGVLNAPLLRAQTLQAQQEAASPVPSFEVASIKPDHGGDGIGRIGAPRGRFTATGITANFLIMFAYNVKPFQISGGPSWLGSERFDIDAKEDDATASKQQALPPSQRIDQIRPMLQSLLADRFKLSIHHTTTEVPIFSLVVTNPGRIPVSQSDCAPPSGPPSAPQPGKWPEPPCGGFFQNFGHIAGGNVPIDRLVSALSIFTGKIVTDNTGLTGKYNITLDWTPDPGQLGPSPPGMSLPQPDPNGPSLPTALEDQLGLKLVSTKGPVDTIVVDHIEEPSPN